MIGTLDSHVPAGDIAEKWNTHRFDMKLVAPQNRRKFDVIVVGSGLAGGAAAATLGEMGYNVTCFCFQDSPRRAHSIAAQGGINAAKNYKNDGDSVYRLFYDTIKGGDFRSREANVHRLAEISVQIIDQCVAQGVPFAREYGGLLDNRSFGGAQVARTFYARGQTGQQLELGAYQALMRQVELGTVEMFSRHEMLDLVTHEDRARGIIVRDLVSGAIERHSAHAVVLATGGYNNIYYLSTGAKGCNATATFRSYRKGALFANPCFTQIHPTCIPVSGEYQSKLTLMSESLRNDGRVWVPKNKDDRRIANEIPEDERDYYLERRYPSFGNLVPRDVASRAAKIVVDDGYGVGELKNGVYLDFADATRRLGRTVVEQRYGNLFDMYANISGEDPYKQPMRIYPAVHYIMAGLWVDYNLMSNLPGLFVLGEANFSDHGANRLGASALMQGLADGYFVLPATIASDLAGQLNEKPLSTGHAAFVEAEAGVRDQIQRLLSIKGSHSVDWFHRRLGQILWDYCGMERTAEGLAKARGMIQELRTQFWEDVKVLGSGDDLNQSLERAGRVADLLDLGDLMCQDAYARNESCGGHFRAEYQTADGEALRDDENFAYVAAWEYQANQDATLHKEALDFEYVHLAQRSYK